MGRVFNNKIDNTDNTLHGSGRAVKKVAYYFRSKKYLMPVMVILHATSLVLKMQWLI